MAVRATAHNSNGTSIRFQVTGARSLPVAGVKVQLIVNGIQMPGLVTDTMGYVVFAWPIKPEFGKNLPELWGSGYNCIYYARHRGWWYPRTKQVLGENRSYDIDIPLQPPEEDPLAALNRFRHRNDVSPIEKRTPAELIRDFEWGMNAVSNFIDTTAVGVEAMDFGFKAEVRGLKNLVREMRQLSRDAEQLKHDVWYWGSKAQNDLANLRNHKPLERWISRRADMREVAGAGKFVGAVSVLADTVTGLYDIIDCAQRDDAEGVKKAVAILALDLLTVPFPPVAAVWTAAKLVYGLGSMLYQALQASPSAVVAIELTSLLPKEFLLSTSCTATKYRIPTKPPYSRCVLANGPGFAWNDRGTGGLVWVTSSRERVPLRIKDEESAVEFMNLVRQLP